jgi:hypothetical protein
MIAPGVVQLALTLTLAREHGAAGAAMAAAAGAACGAVLLASVGRRLIALPIAASELARIAIATAAMAAAVTALGASSGFVGLVAKVSVGALVYAAAAFALDICGVRARAATLLSRLQPLLMERSNARP